MIPAPGLLGQGTCGRAPARTLARESRHIVALSRTGTISRAAATSLVCWCGAFPAPGLGLDDGEEGFRQAAVTREPRWVAMTWTDERVELLKKLWADGLSASRIAAELGGVSRNSVIGKVHRLGLSGRAKSASASVPRQRKRVQHMMRLPRPGVRGNTV